MGTGPLIATFVLLLYTFLAPLVLFGIFVLFDVLGRMSPGVPNGSKGQHFRKKNPAVWTADDIAAFQDEK